MFQCLFEVTKWQAFYRHFFRFFHVVGNRFRRNSLHQIIGTRNHASTSAIFHIFFCKNTNLVKTGTIGNEAVTADSPVSGFSFPQFHRSRPVGEPNLRCHFPGWSCTQIGFEHPTAEPPEDPRAPFSSSSRLRTGPYTEFSFTAAHMASHHNC